MKPIKLKGLIKENKKPIQKEALDDLDVNLPTAVNRFLEKLTSQLKTYNLPRKKEVLVIAKIIDGLNMDKQEVMKAIQKIKQADAFGGQKKNDVGVVAEKAPEGWEGTVKAMKDEPGIDNPYALTNWMKNKGYQSHKEQKINEASGGMKTVKDIKFTAKELDFLILLVNSMSSGGHPAVTSLSIKGFTIPYINQLMKKAKTKIPAKYKSDYNSVTSKLK